MTLNLTWQELKNSINLQDRRKALKILSSLPFFDLNFQEDLFLWFKTEKDVKIKKRLFQYLSDNSKLELLMDKGYSEFLDSIKDTFLKKVFIDFFIIEIYLEGFENSGILWCIKKYMDLKNVSLLEARLKVESFWIKKMKK